MPCGDGCMYQVPQNWSGRPDSVSSGMPGNVVLGTVLPKASG